MESTEFTVTNDSLVGRYFHSFITIDNKRQLQWQGQVTGMIQKGFYLVQTFEWGIGSDCYFKKLISIEDMKDWMFYDDHENFIDNWNNQLESAYKQNE